MSCFLAPFARQNPGRPERGGFYPNLNSAYLDLIQEFSDVIELQLYGHEHNEGLRLTPGPSVALMAPAVTPWDSSDPADPRNPGLRLFQYDGVTGEVLDYFQFHLNLTAANLEGRAEWALQYSFLDYYGLEDMRAGTVEEMVEAMWGEQELMDKYILVRGQ